MADRLNNDFQFIEVGRKDPKKRPLRHRKTRFIEINEAYKPQEAAEQSHRCLECGNPYCEWKCPVHNFIPNWLKLVAEGNIIEAAELSHQTNTLPEVCGRVCPQDRLCEGACTLNDEFGAVTIGSVEKWLGDQAFENGWIEPIRPLAERGRSVGIIGAGPAGLAAADRLRGAGYAVTVYDRHDRAGGLLTYGIPGFKLEKDVVMRRIGQLEDGGVEFVLNCNVGDDISFDAIRGKHDAVLIATGVYKTRDLDIDNADAGGVVRAIDYLTASNKVDFGDDVPDFNDGELNAKGKRVVVIGGGDTAMDCVRTAIRQGAQSVKCLYRRDRANMPGSQREVQNAEEEGVEFVWLSAPGAFAVQGTVDTVRVQKMRLGAPDVSGRQSPELIEGADYDEPAELVIKALGFEPEDLPRLWGVEGLEVTRWGTIKAEFQTHQTSIPGVYAVGDIVRGASLVVWAIRDGREAAEAIADFLTGEARVAAE